MSRAKIFEIAFKIGSKLDPSVQKNFNAASKQMGNMKKNIGSAVKTAAKFAVGAAAMGTAAVGAGAAMASKFAETGDRIDKLSRRLGLSRQGFQEWEFILSQAGVSIDSMQSGMKNLSQRMYESQTQTGKGAELFNRLGVVITDSMSQEEAFEQTIRALQGMEEGVEKATMAQQLFGRSGQELLPLLSEKGGTIDELKEKAHDLGLVIGDEAVDAAVQFTDTMDQIKRSGMGLFNAVASRLMPLFQKFADRTLENLPKIQSTVGSVVDKVVSILGWLGEKGYLVFNGLKAAVLDNLPTFNRLQGVAIEVGGHVQGLFNKSRPYIDWFTNVGIPGAVNVLAGLLDGAINTYNFIKDNWSWIAPIVGGITAALVTYRAVTQSIILVKGALAAAQIAWNVAMTMNPIGLLIVAVGALIGIGIALWKNWDSVKSFFIGLWESMISSVAPVGEAISGAFSSAYEAVTGLFSGLGSWFSGILDSVTGTFRGGVNSIISMANSAINSLNGISVSVPDWVPGVGGKTFGVNIPNIPMLAKGGITTGATLAMIGEGSEQEAVLPLSKLQALLDEPKGSDGTTNNNNDQDNDYSFVYSPNITIEGNADQETLRQALGMSYAEFKRFMDRYLSEKRRLKFG